MKSKDAKKVNQVAKRLNKSLRQDVFGSRFWVKQIKKSRGDGMEYFLYQLKDREDPERDRLIPGWLNVFDVERKLFWEVNDFIVRSNFWAKYWKDKSRYNALSLIHI